jgi:hypothetical protein
MHFSSLHFILQPGHKYDIERLTHLKKSTSIFIYFLLLKVMGKGLTPSSPPLVKPLLEGSDKLNMDHHLMDDDSQFS